MAGAYLVKRLGDELFTKPEPAAADEAEVGDDLDGLVVHDEEDRPVGTAHRIADVAVYVVFDGSGIPEDVFARCLDEPETRLMFQAGDGRITSLIYVPDPSLAPRRPEGLRADDV